MMYSSRNPSASVEHLITIDGEICKVWTAKSGKGTWRAHGRFRDRFIERTASSESAALREWAQYANYEANT